MVRALFSTFAAETERGGIALTAKYKLFCDVEEKSEVYQG
jgi:hypothetical protein